jgi:CRP-like cAMP-binding protein
MFGEVSLLFGCRRTATVKAKQYCECAYLGNKEFLQLLANHASYKQYLIKNIMKSYDDELRIFLVSCLREIDYLANVPEEVLVHMSMTMVAMQADKDSFLYNANDSFGRSMADSLTIIFEGKLVYSVTIDAGTELFIEFIEKGTVLDAHTFLAQQSSSVSVKCLTAVTYYYLPY